MSAPQTGRRRLNWQLVLVLVLAIAVLGGTMFALRKWRRTYLATHALETGLKAFEAKDWSKAASDLGRYCQVHPKEVDPLLKYAAAQMRIYPQKEGNVRWAVNAYRQILRENPTQPDASDRVAEIYLQTGAPGDAELVMSRRLGAQDDPYGRELLAMALAGQRKFREAAQELMNNIKKYPARANSYLLLADLMRTRPEDIPGKPLEILQAGAKANPNSAEAHIALGAFLYQWGGTDKSKEEALAEYAAAKSLDLSDPRLRIRLADRLMAAGDVAGAREQLTAASQQNPSLQDLWSTWAALARTYGTPEEASQVAKAGLAALGPDSGPFLPKAAELYLFGNNEAETKACLDRIEKIEPLSPDIPMIKGLLAQHQNKLPEAIKNWREAVAAKGASPRVMMALAKAYDAAGDTTAAIRQLRAAIAAGGDSAETRILLAKDLSQAGNWWEAGQHSAEAVRLDQQSLNARVTDLSIRAHLARRSPLATQLLAGLADEVAALMKAAPNQPRLAVIAAQIASMQGDTARAEALVKNLQADEATRYEGAMLEVGTLWESGRHKEAIVAMQQVVSEFKNRPDAVEYLAHLLASDGQKAAAVELVSGAVMQADAAGSLKLQLALGQLYFDLGEREKARDVFLKISRDNPSDVTSRIMLLGVYGPGDASAAQKIVNEIRQIEGDSSPRWRYAQAKLWLSSADWQSKHAAASDLLSENVKEDPYDLDSQLLLGMGYERAGNLRLAIETLKGAYERNPESAPVVFNLVSALQKANDLDGADEILIEAAKHGVGGEKLAGLRLGQELRQGKTDLAVATAQEMLANDPDNQSLEVFIARIRMSQGDLAGAEAILNSLSPTDRNVVMTKVDLLLRQKQPDAALALCDKLVESDKSSTSYIVRARARTLAGRYDAAEEDYREAAKVAADKAQCWVLLSDFLVSRGKTEDAVKAAESALKAEKNNPSAAMRLSNLYASSPDAELRKKGQETLDAAVAAHPEDVDLKLYSLRKLVAEGTAESLQQAQKDLGGITLRNPERVDAWALSAQASLKQGLLDAALESVARAMAADTQGKERRVLLLLKAEAEKLRWPALAAATLKGLYDSNTQDTAVGTALAIAYREAGEDQKAVALLKSMRQSATGASAVSIELSLIDAIDAAGDHSEAVQRATALATQMPDDPRAILMEALVLGRMGRWDDARAALAVWQDKHPQDTALMPSAAKAFMETAATIAAQEGAGTKARSAAAQQAALAVLEETHARRPNDLAVKESLASVYQSTGNIDKAEQMYRKILADNGDQGVMINNLAWLLCEDRQKPQEALTLADRGRKLYPSMPELIDTRGVIYERLGRLDDARGEFEECVRTAPVSAPVSFSARLHLARVLSALNRKSEAGAALKDLLACTPCLLSAQEKSEGQALFEKLNAEMTLPAK